MPSTVPFPVVARAMLVTGLVGLPVSGRCAVGCLGAGRSDALRRLLTGRTPMPLMTPVRPLLVRAAVLVMTTARSPDVDVVWLGRDRWQDVGRCGLELVCRLGKRFCGWSSVSGWVGSNAL
jgi:hypothetical protein